MKLIKGSCSPSSSDYTPFIATQPKRYPRLTILLIAFASLLVIGGIVLLSWMGISEYNKWSYSYDRNQDAGLLNLISVSPGAVMLPDKGEIFCWVLTSEKYHDTRALAVNETWLRRCDHGVFFTNAPFEREKKIPYRTVFAGILDSYENLFYKSRYAFYYISEIMKADFDWFVKADDDTYLIVENLRAYLRTLDPSLPYYVGYRMKPYLENGYNGGGAGYVLSKKALELFAREAYVNETICPDDIYEDVGIGRCLANLGILPHKSVNEQGQQRFNTYHPVKTLEGWSKQADWITDPLITGFDGIARDLISFHHVSPTEMKIFDVLLYRVSVDGVCRREHVDL
ncbi:hypothetical protein PMAYCL1PPCAC_28687 [Pristionchus mayeri]|uniref:N-acetylgalactosaminide beta-1,3-galactosyltransferase n=1 Tax=Pristionchus mayeri TaxID=1317129 RepID=A0AAN5DA93_9BILA|nr:hypothetical protein PMAYCL1PPCAC_28687 [Pristionchus mayeri]